MALLEAPAVQLWGWPGTGKSGILAALAGRAGSVGLALGDTESAARWKSALARARDRGAAWAVLAAPPSPAALDRAVRWLPSGLRLAFAGVDRAVLPLRTAYVYPPELLLDPAEVREVWRTLSGVELAPESASALRAATDGWLHPLRLLASSGRELPASFSPEALIDADPALDGFFRSEVATALPELDFDRWGEEDLAALVGTGLALGDEANPRLPRLLAAWVERRGRDAEGLLRARAKGGSLARRRQAPSAPAIAPAPLGGPAFRVALLGRPQVERLTETGAVAIRFPLRRSFQTLAYLASSPDRSASRDELIEEIWSGESPGDVLRNFHPTLSHLRRSLSAGIKPKVVPLLLHEGIYRLNPEIDWQIDWVELSVLVERARGETTARPEAAVEHLRRAWSLYRGSFLPRVDGEWAAPRRDQSQRIYLELLKSLGDLELQLGHHEPALDAYRALLSEDPLEERIHVAVMRLYGEEGRRDLVRRQYDRLCSLLLGELGLEPLEETTREFHQLMA
jgi:DNA-binding SARP family transcriptional activator